jgi:Big-like domain-containing protein
MAQTTERLTNATNTTAILDNTANISKNDTATNLNNTANLIKNATNALNNTANLIKNATNALNNTANNFTESMQSNSNISAARPALAINSSGVNASQATQAIFNSALPYVFIIVIFLVLIIPLVFDMYLAYKRKANQTKDRENNRVSGMPGLYRALMTFGVILLVGTVIFYLLTLITLNLNNSSPVIQSLIDLLKNLGTILGTALATIIAFYFGMRGAESAAEKAVNATKEKALVGTTLATDTEIPKVLNFSPLDGALGIPVNSPITATFSESLDRATANNNSFTLKDSNNQPISGAVSLSQDGKTLTFQPNANLAPGTLHHVTITGVKDLAGNVLVPAKTWSFTT